MVIAIAMAMMVMGAGKAQAAEDSKIELIPDISYSMPPSLSHSKQDDHAPHGLPKLSLSDLGSSDRFRRTPISIATRSEVTMRESRRTSNNVDGA